MPNNIFHLTMSEVREKFLTCVEKGGAALNFKKPGNVSVADALLRRRSSAYGGATFSGATVEEFVNYMHNGYTVPELNDFDTSLIPVRKKRRARFNDCEGDFRPDLFMSGDDNCFMEWTKREAVPGIHVQFFLGFTAVVPASVITDYCKWTLQALTTLEANGVDCSVSVYNRGRARYARNSENETSEFHIDIKREGERNDFTDWSAFLAPGSYRILGFFCLILMSEFNERTCSTYFGGSTGRNWGVTFNEEYRIIEINADSRSREFPAERMTAELGEAIAKARG